MVAPHVTKQGIFSLIAGATLIIINTTKHQSMVKRLAISAFPAQ